MILPLRIFLGLNSFFFLLDSKFPKLNIQICPQRVLGLKSTERRMMYVPIRNNLAVDWIHLNSFSVSWLVTFGFAIFVRELP